MSENKYNNSKIYLIKCRLDNNLIYVGSTVRTLYDRWNQHKKTAQKTNHKKHRLLYNKINEIGINFFYIELYEQLILNNNQELLNKEGEIIKKLSTLNYNIPGVLDENEYNDLKNKVEKERNEYKNKKLSDEQQFEKRLLKNEYLKKRYNLKKLEKEQII
jgi:hypothetical protein